MDGVYRFNSTKTTKTYDIKEYFDTYSKYIKRMSSENHAKEDICGVERTKRINFDGPELQKLSQICKIGKLNYLGEDKANNAIIKKKKYNPDDFSSIGFSNTALEELGNLIAHYVNSNSKKISLKYLTEQPIYHTEILRGEKAVPKKDILISVRVYNPFVSDSRHGPASRRKITLLRVISILGHQTLAQLRDNIECLSDLSVLFESSNNPSAAKLLKSNKKLYRSGFFYIENTFYNDERDNENKDNSASIRKWATRKNFGPFDVKKMEDTRLDSLNVRFCYPWLYQHQGNCEHLIVFNDARLVNTDDYLEIENYPRVERIRCVRYSSCMLCTERPVYWITVDSDRVPHNPCYFCKPCFESYNYVNGKKIGNFKAYRFPCDPTLEEDIRNYTKVEPELMGQS